MDFERQFIDALSKIDKYEAEATALRAEELKLLARRAKLLPNNAESQNDYGLMLALFEEKEEAERRIVTAVRLEPNNPRYRQTLAFFYQKYKQWDEAMAAARKLIEMRPNEIGYRELLLEIGQQAAADRAANPRSLLDGPPGISPGNPPDQRD